MESYDSYPQVADKSVEEAPEQEAAEEEPHQLEGELGVHAYYAAAMS